MLPETPPALLVCCKLKGDAHTACRPLNLMNVQGDISHVEAYLPVILVALRTQGISVSAAAAATVDALGPAAPAPHPDADNVELLEALREVAKVYAAADVLVSRHVVELFAALSLIHI